MPSHKSCEKRLRQDTKRRAKNNYVKATINTLSKKIRAKTDNKEEAEKLLFDIFAKLDKAAKRGIIHKRTASRRKKRLAHHFNKLSSDE